MNDGYEFSGDEITYAANSIYDRDPESEKKYRFFNLSSSKSFSALMRIVSLE
ncbi:hypothetical protein JCM19052_2010 [Vibrio sp. JCM 19052]|nr:hypothetical protein JCM19052_2010 [Vibrio sp. JCM 19052]